jgi:hypothetical protein
MQGNNSMMLVYVCMYVCMYACEHRFYAGAFPVFVGRKLIFLSKKELKVLKTGQVIIHTVSQQRESSTTRPSKYFFKKYKYK